MLCIYFTICNFREIKSVFSENIELILPTGGTKDKIGETYRKCINNHSLK